MKKIVISQPMFFPWIGIFEQLALCDIFVYFDDVQLPQGRSFIHRVKIKSSNGPLWLSVPLKRKGKQSINQVEIDQSIPWRKKHLKTLTHCYSKAPFGMEVIELVRKIYSYEDESLAELNIRTISTFAQYFGLKADFKQSSKLEATASSSLKLMNIIKAQNAQVYITGHGAKNYLEHQLFEQQCIDVQYMNYKNCEYPQLHGDFISHMSIIDLAAMAGPKGIEYINSQTQPWRKFVNG